MATHESNLTDAFSRAKRWHVCERYEAVNLPCPLRLAQMEEDDDVGEKPTPIPNRPPTPRGLPNIDWPGRPRIPRPPPEDDDPPPANYPTPIDLPILEPEPSEPPTDPATPADDVPSAPRPKSPPGPVPPFPGWDQLLWFPDGTPIPPADPRVTLNILRKNDLADDLPDPEEEEGLYPNYGEVYSIWIPRLLNLAFKHLTPLLTPGLSPQRAWSNASSDGLAANSSLNAWIQASSAAEEEHIQSLLMRPTQYDDTEKARVTPTAQQGNFRLLPAIAIAGATLAATGAIAISRFGGGGGGLIGPSAVEGLMNPAMAR